MKTFTLEQSNLVKDFIELYGLSEEQISFDGETIEPIFDFEALCVLREKLTRFQSVDTSKTLFNQETNEAECVCTIITQNNLPVSVSDFAQIGEMMPDGKRIENSMQAKRVARARAMRSGIRAAGVNLLKAHKSYVESCDILDFKPVDPRIAKRKEVHVLAKELGLIKDEDKSEYQKFIAETYDGRTSSNDLEEKELQRLIVTFRAMRRLQNVSLAA
jgi:hypothetical protein